MKNYMVIELGDNMNLEIGYFNHRRCNPDWNISEDLIDFYDVTYVVGGEADYTVEGHTYHVSGGDLLCIPIGSARSAVTSRGNPMECYAVNFKLVPAAGEEPLFSMPMVSRIGIHMDIVSLYEDLKYAWLRRSPGYMIESKALLLRILVRFYELSMPESKPAIVDYRVEKAARYIVDHYAEDITIDTLAMIAGLNRNYFGALFKDTTGMTFRQFLTLIRLNRADALLAIGKSGMESIAARCGFSDVCYFSRVYKKNRGISPSQAKKQIGRDISN